jgi:hypothetical protein
MKTIIISGCRYTYDDKLYLVVIMSLMGKPYREGCFYRNALFHKSMVYTHKSVLRCRMEMADIAKKICPGLVYHSKDQVYEKDSGLYDGNNIIYKVGGWHFRHIYFSGFIKPIDEEITHMLHCGVQHARNFMELLVRKGLAEQLHLIRMTEGMLRCHYPLQQNDAECDAEENDYWQSRSRMFIEPVNMPRYYDN